MGLHYTTRYTRRRQPGGTVFVAPFPYYTGWGQTHESGASGGQQLVSPLITGPIMGMLTRKQQWRRTRTRNKQSWGDFPPEVLEAMLGGNGAAGMIKSVSWDHSYTVGSRQRADQRRTDVNPAAKHDDANVEPNSHPSSSAGSHGIPEVHIPRSVSCSSLAEKRTLFPRSSSGDGLGTDRAAVTGTGSQIGSKVRHRVLHRRGVRFDTQVRFFYFLARLCVIVI